MRAPDYQGGGLVNLAAEIESRLSGRAASPGLRAELARHVPDAETYVLVLLDGLGDLQLAEHGGGTTLEAARRGGLDASFSTQTSVATATLATGLPPSRHGLLSYLLDLPGGVTNTLWWFRLDGSPSQLDLESFLPSPNLAERLAAAGVSSTVVEPSAYLGSPLDRVLYRGSRAGVDDEAELVEVALEEASRPGRFVVVYLPHVDAAAHAEGTRSRAYASAIETVDRVWATLADELPSSAALVGTADHGMVDVDPEAQVEVPPPTGVTLYGDSRVLYVRGDAEEAEKLAASLPATWLPFPEVADWWGPAPRHPEFARRAPQGLIHADPGHTLHPPGDGVRLVGYHGGATEQELRIPLLVAG